MKSYKLLCLTLISVFSCCSYAQEGKINSGDKKYDNYAYIDAIKTYERVAGKGYKSEDLFKKLANSYYFNSNFEKAAKWYGELFAMNTQIETEYYYRYAQSLKSAGETVKANQILDEFDQRTKNDSRARLYVKDKNYLEEIKANSGRYKIENAGINSKFSDYGTFIHNNTVYFASARDTGNFTQRKHTWTGEHFTNLYQSAIDENFNLSAPKEFKSKINTKFNESTPVFTKDGKTVYFTRNNYNNGKKGKNDSQVTLLKIYKATLENGEWTNITELPFNSDNYSTAHPALSADEKTLYFASDMPGTYGQSDIYKVSISNGKFGNPENLGPTINTEGKETFPYVTSDNEIYFASDGHPGLGGLDVFVGKLDQSGVSNIQNLGSDINSPQDDFGYIIDENSKKGFFTSNRPGGQGSDDIYKFLETRSLHCSQELTGTVISVATAEALANTKLFLYDARHNLVSSTISDPKGFYSFVVDCGKVYFVRAEKENYATKEEPVTISKENGKTDLPIALEGSECRLTIGDDLGKCFNITNIYFDLDKSTITPKAVIDLEKILDVLTQYPLMKLDIRSHTDSRASYKYNEALSERRAKSTIEWLVKNGVDKSRLTGKGYGESQLVNRCSDGVKCSEEEHQMNRRSEFIVTAL